ncbi:hypothetical protein DEO72_LG3g1188 [Vigna unguiculata]|uniref:Uncharacterized protein n=1 Tax=Vigna unguiculata TaxID=3917 RepID=A0A4D6LEH5_VIGUN|nr:hypothetical protein DEO72_LG3g1188 [Vigna unguiculata]
MRHLPQIHSSHRAQIRNGEQWRLREGGVTLGSRAGKKREGDDSGSWVLIGDAFGGGWRRRRHVSPTVGLVAAAPVLVARWLEASEKGLPFVK